MLLSDLAPVATKDSLSMKMQELEFETDLDHGVSLVHKGVSNEKEVLVIFQGWDNLLVWDFAQRVALDFVA